jgi:hypothetical protein
MVLSSYRYSEKDFGDGQIRIFINDFQHDSLHARDVFRTLGGIGYSYDYDVITIVVCI